MKNNILLILLIIVSLLIITPPHHNTSIIHSTNNLCDFYNKYQDQEPPLIVLKENKEISLPQGSIYQEPGAIALDNCDGLITNKIKITGHVNVNKIGTYYLKYQVEDSNNNINTTQRIINIEENKEEKGVIYLTFDDGPSTSITPKILAILKQENIKASFFIINHPSNTDYLINQIIEEGHTLGLHSYTHNYSYIYSSLDNYFQDLTQIQDKVSNLTGLTSKIIRFPGGTSNTISKNYSEGIMTNLVSEVTNKGYNYYDWSIDSKDSGGVKSSEEVYNNVVNNLSLNKINMILFHDFENNYYTLDALPQIIKYAKDNGYTFKNITSSTKKVQHHPNN